MPENPKPQTNISYNIRLIRKRWGLSQVEFAKLVGSERARISNAETAKNQPSSELLLRLEELTRIPIYTLLTERLRPSSVRKYPVMEEYSPYEVDLEDIGVVKEPEAGSYDTYELAERLLRQLIEIIKTHDGQIKFLLNRLNDSDEKSGD